MEIRPGPPTKRQAVVLAFITDYTDEHGYAPTLAEIGQAMGLRSQATVHKHLMNLRYKGLITRQWGRSRSMAVSDRCPTCGRLNTSAASEAKA